VTRSRPCGASSATVALPSSSVRLGARHRAGRRARGRRARAADPLRVAAEFVAALPHPVLVAALDRRVLAANRSAAQLFGCGLDQLLCASLDELVVPRERRQVAAQDRRALRGEAQRYDTTVMCADGQERHVGVVTTRLVLEGSLIGTVATLSERAALIPPGGDGCIQSCAAIA
jgi:PAS domain S-box-containing protein